MRDIYGQNGTQSISAECNTRCLFRTNDPETAEWISKSIGMQETQTFNEGLSYGANEIRDGVTLQQHEKTKPLVLASEIQNMPNLELFLKLQGQPITKTTIKYKERQKVAKGFVQKVMSLEEQKYLKEEDRRIDEEIEEVEEESEDEGGTEPNSPKQTDKSIKTNFSF